MKNICIFLMLVISFNVSSQEKEQQFFVGNDSDLLIGKTVIVKEGKTNYGDFYKNQDLTARLFKKGNGSDPEKLKGLSFVVISAVKNPKPYKDEIILTLKNDKTGLVYYSYMPKFPDLFQLDIVGGMTPPEGFLCGRLISRKDKFSSKVTTDTPSTFEYSITKIEDNDKNRLYLRLQLYGTTLNVGKAGVKILFKDGTVLEKPEANISSKAEAGGYVYSSFINLTKEDIEILTTKIISDYSLYIYERKIKDYNAYELKEYLKCLNN